MGTRVLKEGSHIYPSSQLCLFCVGMEMDLLLAWKLPSRLGWPAAFPALRLHVCAIKTVCLFVFKM